MLRDAVYSFPHQASLLTTDITIELPQRGMHDTRAKFPIVTVQTFTVRFSPMSERPGFMIWKLLEGPLLFVRLSTY